MKGPATMEGAGHTPAKNTTTINTQDQAGMTLIEALIVISIIGVLAVVAGGSYLDDFTSETRVRTAARGVMADLLLAQSDAESQGGNAMLAPAGPEGQLRRRWEYMVFDTTNNAYSLWRYQDTDGDNIKDPEEVSPAPGFPASKKLPRNVSFGLTYKNSDGDIVKVGRSGCGNDLGTPSSPVSFSTLAAPPCYGKKCMKMNSGGYPSFTGTLYLSNGTHAFAVNINAAGLVRLCQWSEENMKWVDSY